MANPITMHPKGFMKTIVEMIGRLDRNQNLFEVNSYHSIYSDVASFDYSKVNTNLTKALFNASIIRGTDGKHYGQEFLLGAVFAKPIVNAAASFIIGSMPSVKIEEASDEDSTNDEQSAEEGDEYDPAIQETQNAVAGWLDINKSPIFKTVRNSLRDGDAYIRVQDDLSLQMLPASQMDIIVDDVTGALIGYDRHQKRFAKDGKTEITYRTEYRKTSPQVRVFQIKDGKETEMPEYQESRSGERELDIVGFHNEREPEQLYGNSEYQSCLNLFLQYNDVLKDAIKNHKYNAGAIPVISGIENMTKFLEANGTRSSASGKYEFKWDKGKMLLGGKDLKASIVNGAQTAGEASTLLNILFWLICQTSETPEFVFGTAVQSSKASVSEQMPVMVAKAQRKQNEFTGAMMELVSIYFRKAIKQNPLLIENPKFSIKWADIVGKDLKLNLEIVKVLSEEGCITNETKLMLLDMQQEIPDLKKEIEKAKLEQQANAPEEGDPTQPTDELDLVDEDLTPEELALARTPAV